MKPHKNNTWLRPTLATLALVCATGLSRAQTAQDYIVSQFDDGTTQGWSYNYGGAPFLGEFDPNENRGPVGNGAGAMKCTIGFDLCNLTSNNQCDWEKVLPAAIDLTKFTKLHFSVKVDPSSARLSDWGAGQMGPIRPHIRLSGWGGDVSINPSSDSQWVGSDYGTWHDYSMPIDQTVSANLGTLQACGILGLQMWSAWGTCAAPIGLTNQVIFWIDNIWFETNANPIVIPPTMGLKKSGPNGVLIQMDNNGQWEREGISTPAPNGSSIWTAQGGYPVSYSMTITNFAARAQHQGFEAHMYIVNGDTAGSGNDTGGSPDWNCPDLLLFRVENAANGAMAQIQWKTNLPTANSPNIPVVVYPPAVDGTWTVTFTDSTHGSVSGPGITTTNFTLPSDAVTANFSPATSFVHFGMFKNDGANDGHNNTASGTFSHVTINGQNAPIDDDFSGLSLTNKYAWRRSNTSVVQYVVPGTVWNVSWTVPAYGFNPYVASSVSGPWNPLTVLNQYQGGTNTYAAIGTSALPVGGNAFFKMAKYPYVKLQVLLPGEKAAPNTPTGKTGTPDAQTGGVPFNITVNAVDQYWNVVPTPDYISITSSDTSALLPNPTLLAGGSATLQVTLITSGSTTITASDLTDTTKTPNTSSPITVP